MKPPFVLSLLEELRKKLTKEIFDDINDMILENNMPDDHDDRGYPGNSGSMIFNAT